MAAMNATQMPNAYPQPLGLSRILMRTRRAESAPMPMSAIDDAMGSSTFWPKRAMGRMGRAGRARRKMSQARSVASAPLAELDTAVTPAMSMSMSYQDRNGEIRRMTA